MFITLQHMWKKHCQKHQKRLQSCLLNTWHRRGKIPWWRQVKPGTIISVKKIIIFMKIIYSRTRKKSIFLHCCSVLHNVNSKVWSLHGSYRCCSESRSHWILKETVVWGGAKNIVSWHEECLINLLEYQNIKREIKKNHKSTCMGIVSRFQSHKAKLNKESNDDNCKSFQMPLTPGVHR